MNRVAKTSGESNAPRAARPTLVAGSAREAAPSNDSSCDAVVERAPEAPSLAWLSVHAEMWPEPTSYDLERAARTRRAKALGTLLRTTLSSAVGFARRLLSRYLRQLQARRMHRVLSELDDRTLRDLGFNRCEIGSVAAEAYGLVEHTRMRDPLSPRPPS
jgi:uncharacterized protein YjiS (DUF1127 family)